MKGTLEVCLTLPKLYSFSPQASINITSKSLSTIYDLSYNQGNTANMPRYSRNETHTDGDGYVYDSRYDPSEFSAYGQDSYGPSSTSPYSTSRPFRSSPSNRAVYDKHGYPMEGAYAGEEDLRQHMSRYQFGKSGPASSLDPRTSLGRGTLDRESAYSRPSRPSQQVHLDNRSARHKARQCVREQVELEYALQCKQDREHRRAEQATYDERNDNLYVRSRSGGGRRRGAATAANDKYLAYQQALREEQQARYDSTQSTVHGCGRGWLPAYEFR